MMKMEVDFAVYENGKRAPEYTLETDLNGEVSLADFLNFTKLALIVTADTVLKEEQAMGFDKNPVVLVDGRFSKTIAEVKPLGKIEINARADLKNMLLETYSFLIRKSPVWKGNYVAHHYVFLNGHQVASDMSSLTAWLESSPQFEDRDIIRFVNIMPYARKLERAGITEGKTKPRTRKSRDKKEAAKGIRVAAPNGVYYLTTQAIRRKYKRNSFIRFQFMPGTTLGIKANLKNTGGSLHRTHFKSVNGKKRRAYLYPTIMISVREAGLL